MTEKEFLQIKELLDQHHVSYYVMDHAPTPTSEIAVRVTGTKPEEGAKAIVLRSKGRFLMCVLSGNRKIDLKKVRMILGHKTLSLATPEEVKKATGCDIGSVHPFGNLCGIQLYADRNLIKHEMMTFSAGMVTKSIRMKSEEYLQLSKAVVEDFYA